MELLWSKISNPLKNFLGNNTQQGSTFYDGDSTEQYALITTSHDILEFKYKKSVALCVGIDKQYHQEYTAKSLENVVARDAKEIGEAFVTNMGFIRNRVKVRVSSVHPNECTKGA